MTASAESNSLPASAAPDWLVLVREKVEGLRDGVGELTVYDGHVTQIERTEKTRLRVSRESRRED